jgi:hypothetical protein
MLMALYSGKIGMSGYREVTRTIDRCPHSGNAPDQKAGAISRLVLDGGRDTILRRVCPAFDSVALSVVTEGVVLSR